MSPRKKKNLPPEDTPAPARPPRKKTAGTVTPIAPSVTPLISSKQRFRPMMQGTGTNQFSQISTRNKKPEIDAMSGLARITDGSLTVFFDSYDSLTGGLRVSTHKLLDACIIQLSAQTHFQGDGKMDTLVTIPLDDYMVQCGIPLTKASKDKTRRKVKEDLEALYNISLEWTERTGQGGTQDYAKMRIISMHSIKSGIIHVRFSEEMTHYLTHAYIMQYSMELFKVDERNPNAYALGKKMLLHASNYNNQKKKTDRILSVKTLLEVASDIPTYDEVMASDRHVDQRIIQAFDKALNALSNVLTWHYCNAKGAPLTEKQVDNFTYDTFIKCYVCFGGLGNEEEEKKDEEKKDEEKTEGEDGAKEGDGGERPPAAQGLCP